MVPDHELAPQAFKSLYQALRTQQGLSQIFDYFPLRTVTCVFTWDAPLPTLVSEWAVDAFPKVLCLLSDWSSGVQEPLFPQKLKALLRLKSIGFCFISHRFKLTIQLLLWSQQFKLSSLTLYYFLLKVLHTHISNGFHYLSGLFRTLLKLFY